MEGVVGLLVVFESMKEAYEEKTSYKAGSVIDWGRNKFADESPRLREIRLGVHSSVRLSPIGSHAAVHRPAHLKELCCM